MPVLPIRELPEVSSRGQVTVKTRIKEHMFWGLRLILFLFIGCFLQNQSESVLKVFLKLF